MKLSILAFVISVVTVVASPSASSLKRGFKEVDVPGEYGPVQIACIECPCDGWDPNSCQCIPNGCCCNWSQPTTTGWLGARATAA
ncbi:hypothetical protein IQ06DRAFT_343520 [Phaeosphaeriaceae sp. SRC1lsM3a]|nr:hypothetical protein IQ06DRAFT_343520 [Stagonospora sp. SRC1lsM3a]